VDVSNLKSKVFIPVIYFLKLKEKEGGTCSIVSRLWAWHEESWFDSQQGKKELSHLQSIQIRSATTQPPFQWVSWILSLQIHQIGWEADHSSASSTKFNEWSYTNTAQCAHMVCTGTNLPFPLIKSLILFTCLENTIISLTYIHHAFIKPGIFTVVMMRIWSSTNNHTAYWLHSEHIHVTTNGNSFTQTLGTCTTTQKNA